MMNYLLWNRIVKFLYKNFTHEKTLTKIRVKNLLQNGGNTFDEFPDKYLIKDHNHQIEIRKSGSDLEVFEQILVNQEYALILDYFKINNIEPKFIVDCGANIGLTSIQLASNFKRAQILAIEPDLGNFKQLIENTKYYDNILTLNKAIWRRKTRLGIDKSFGDKKDWSIRTVEKSYKTGQFIETITLDEIIENSEFRKIDFLKIDIEGAEHEIFKSNNASLFLKNTNCIALEIHDEFANRKHIYSVLIKADFKIFNSGELTIGIKNERFPSKL